jgi:hypothetical protein
VEAINAIVLGFWRSQLVKIRLASPILESRFGYGKDGGVRWWLRCGPWRRHARLAVRGSGGETRAAGRRNWWRGLARTASGVGRGNLPSPRA